MGDDALATAQSDCLPETPENYCTIQEAAQALNLRVADIERALDSHQIPCTHHFSRRLIARADLDTFRVQTEPTAPAE